MRGTFGNGCAIDAVTFNYTGNVTEVPHCQARQGYIILR